MAYIIQKTFLLKNIDDTIYSWGNKGVHAFPKMNTIVRLELEHANYDVAR